jgi:hypothetical protein
MLKKALQNKEQPRDLGRYQEFMSNTGPKTLAELSQRAETAFGKLARESSRRSDLTAYLCGRLPAELASGVDLCSVGQGGLLTVLCHGPAWASRLRFETEQILTICREREPGIINVQIKVSSAG